MGCSLFASAYLSVSAPVADSKRLYEGSMYRLIYKADTGWVVVGIKGCSPTTKRCSEAKALEPTALYAKN
jgi:hypothetical protein